MIDSLPIDAKFLLFLNGLGSPRWDSFWLAITKTWSGVPLYVLLLWYCLKFFNWKQVLLIILLTALMITASDQVCNLFKNVLVKRLRPCHNDLISGQLRLAKEVCGGLYGYYSAHASNSFALAVFFGLLLGRRAALLVVFGFIWASLSAYSRLYMGVHYPLDTLSGAFFGSLIGLAFYRLLKRIAPTLKKR